MSITYEAVLGVRYSMMWDGQGIWVCGYSPRALHLVGMVWERSGSGWGWPCVPTHHSPIGSAHGLLHKDRQFVNDVWPLGRHSPLSRQTSPCNKPYMNLEGLGELSSLRTCPGHGDQVFIKFWRAKKKRYQSVFLIQNGLSTRKASTA